MQKGIDFEKKTLEFLKSLFGQLGFQVTEARQQDPGTQNGFDLKIGFIDHEGKQRSFYFECKEYTTKISWDAISAKISQVDASGHKPDGYIAISPLIDFSNIHVSVLENQESRLGFPIRYWTPSANVGEYFSLDDGFYQSVYGKAPANVDKGTLRGTLKNLIKAMLRRKDELIDGHHRTIPKELTNKLPRIDPEDVIGRDAELVDVHKMLFSNKHVVVVNGLGGIGKTALGQAYLSCYYDIYKHVAWVTQVTQDIVNDIVNADGLAESLSISKQGKDPKELFQEIVHGLKAIHGSPNLLLLDNVDDNLKMLKDFLPGPPHWHVLATSRLKIDGFHPKELGFLLPEQAVALFKKHCTLIVGDEEVLELVKTVDYHTLTIEILAKVAQDKRVGIGTLKSAIKDDLKANVYIPHNSTGEKIENVRSYLSSIFNLSSLNEDEVWLMKQFSCLPAEYHAYSLLLELIDPDENKKETFAETCNGLVKQGWLMYNSKDDAYKMHIVVQDVAKQKLPVSTDDIGGLFEIVTEKLKVDQTKDNPVDKFKWVPFGYSVLDCIGNDISDNIAVLQINLAMVLKDLGEYGQARDLLQKAVLAAEKNFGEGHPITIVSYSNLALVLKDLGEYGQARDLLQKAMLSDEKNFGEGHPRTAIFYSNLAIVLLALGEYGQARELLQKAMLSDEKNFGEEHPTTATSYSNLALVLQKLKEYEQARDLLQKAVFSDKKNFGEGHPTTAISYSNLASVLQDLGEYEQARDLYQKVVDSTEKYFGTNHPITALRYSNFALVLVDLEEYDKASILAEKALAILKNTLPAGHPNIRTVQGVVDRIKSKL